MTRKTLSLLLALSLILFSLTGCGGGSDSLSPEPASTPDTAVPAASPSDAAETEDGSVETSQYLGGDLEKLSPEGEAGRRRRADAGSLRHRRLRE